MLYLSKHWQKITWLSVLLLPVSLIYYLAYSVRKLLYRAGILKKTRIGIPVIVVGNITVGGTGKTPLVIWLVNLLRQNGYKPGVVSRGYGRADEHEPRLVKSDNDVSETGDEPAIIFQNCACPVMIDANRARGAMKLVKEHQCDVIISDDGLQHTGLQRDLEICVIDGTRGNGNNLLLPAGPLREPVARLNSVDAVIVNNRSHPFGFDNEYGMFLKATKVVNLTDENLTREISEFDGKIVHGIAGIGNPAQFFEKLRSLGMTVVAHPFPDHYMYKVGDIKFTEHPVVMTEKDAVKLKGIMEHNVIPETQYWYLPVIAEIDRKFEKFILDRLRESVHG